MQQTLPVHSLSQHMHTNEVIYFFMDSSIHLLEPIPLKMTWMNGSYTVNVFVAFGTN